MRQRRVSAGQGEGEGDVGAPGCSETEREEQVKRDRVETGRTI